MGGISDGARGPGCAQVDVRTHVVLVPAILALAAILAHRSGFDHAVTNWFFDEATRAFPARRSAILELVGHRWANGAIVCLFLSLVTCATLANWLQPLRRYRRLLFTTAVAMSVGPMMVVALKSITAARCPWALAQYGGQALAPDFWFATPMNAGECFPGGHAAGGFALVALFFAGKVSGNRVLERSGLLAAVAAGTAFSVVRMSQGAHFLSHNLWSAALDWCLAATVFRHGYNILHHEDPAGRGRRHGGLGPEEGARGRRLCG